MINDVGRGKYAGGDRETRELSILEVFLFDLIDS